MSRTYAHACHGGITLYQKRCPMNESAILDTFEKTRQHKGELHHFISAFALAVPGAGPAVTLVDIPYRLRRTRSISMDFWTLRTLLSYRPDRNI